MCLQETEVSSVCVSQVHEPCLTIFDSDDTIAVTTNTYHLLATHKVPIHLVIPYDDVSEAMYQCVINLPVHAIGFDFCGVPGATSGNEMFTLIATHGFPKVCEISCSSQLRCVLSYNSVLMYCSQRDSVLEWWMEGVFGKIPMRQ